jgi:hypothetical protein
MMFAHAAFEREVRELQGDIADDPGFGERRENQWSARLVALHDRIDQETPRRRLLAD